jgi:hypothetical protein
MFLNSQHSNPARKFSVAVRQLEDTYMFSCMCMG